MTHTVGVTATDYGQTPDGQTVQEFTLTNAHGISVSILNYGGIITAVNVPDRDGKLENVALHFDSLAGYLGQDPYFGALIGRYGNRIAGGKFTLDGTTYTLATNNGPNSLHGGKIGFNERVWDVKLHGELAKAAALQLVLVSENGEEGYPGTLTTTVMYRLTDDNELKIEYHATTTRATPINLTNHCYWNLAGAGDGTILNHRLTLHADKFLPVDSTLIPTGELAPVAGTPMDFTKPQKIGQRIKQVGGEPIGYDHCYIINGEAGELRPAAKVVDPESGRVMEVSTTEPAVQFYSGNFLDGSEGGGGYPQYGGFCLEAEHYPDSPNQPAFPNTILKPGDTYTQTTVHKFSVQKKKPATK